jgi:hypothetical protein
VPAIRIETEPVQFNIQGAAGLNGCCGLSAKFEIPQKSKKQESSENLSALSGLFARHRPQFLPVDFMS